MRLTKNTNKTIRTWVDSILNQLDLVICEGNYREVYERLSTHRICNSDKKEVIDSLTIGNRCITKSEKASRLSVRKTQTRICDFIQTL